MENPIQKTKDLLASLEFILTNKQDLAAVPKSIITEMIQQVREIHMKLDELQKYVSLDYDTHTKELLRNLQSWNDLKSGYIKEKEEIKSIVINSKTLNTLYKKRIDILSIYKFSKEEIKLSAIIGTIFFTNSLILDRIKMAYRDGYFTINAKNFIIAENILKKFIKNEIILDCQIEKLNPKNQAWESIKRDKVGWLIENVPQAKFKFILKFNNSQHRSLIEGHWFNAYTYQIIFDHLERNEFDFEIYTRVSYESPQEIFMASGDFDIIAMVGQKILLVECKSGNLREDNDEIDKIVNKTEGLRIVFDTIGQKYEYEFMFVHNPNVEISEGIRAKLNSALINVVKINNVSGAVEKIFQK